MSETEVEKTVQVEVPSVEKNILSNGNVVEEKLQNGRKSNKRKNQFGDEDDEYMTVETWNRRWRNGQTKFHMQKVHPTLQKYFSWLSRDGEKNRIFLPLCGKSLDIKWLADKGQDVVGNECSVEGVKQFFEEHDLEYTVESIKVIAGDIYKAKNLDIAIYCCDFFQITPKIIGTFDAVWDRGSLAAINTEDREKYADVFVKLLKKDGRCLLDIFQVDHEHFAGPPHTLPPKTLQELYGKHMKLERVSTCDALNAWQKQWGVSYFIQDDYYVTWKADDNEDKDKCEQ